MEPFYQSESFNKNEIIQIMEKKSISIQVTNILLNKYPDATKVSKRGFFSFFYNKFIEEGNVLNH